MHFYMQCWVHVGSKYSVPPKINRNVLVTFAELSLFYLIFLNNSLWCLAKVTRAVRLTLEHCSTVLDVWFQKPNIFTFWDKNKKVKLIWWTDATSQNFINVTLVWSGKKVINLRYVRIIGSQILNLSEAVDNQILSSTIVFHRLEAAAYIWVFLRFFIKIVWRFLKKHQQPKYKPWPLNGGRQ